MTQTPESKQWAMILHLSQFAGFVVPVAGLVVPIVIWQIKKEEFPELDAHGRVVANWIITELILGVISFILVFVVVGIFLLIALSVVGIAFPIIGGLKANEGKLWNYPLSFKFL